MQFIVLAMVDYSCDQTPATNAHAPKYEHEEIASFCLRSPLFGGDVGFEKAENEWAQSEVGEGVEEVWARSVSLPSLSIHLTQKT